MRWGLSRQDTRERERRERQYQVALDAYNLGAITRIEFLIGAGLAPRAVKLAYRFPRLFGRRAPLAAADRLRPMYAPKGGWRVLRSETERWPSEPAHPSFLR